MFFIILSTQRSGSHMLQTMLNSHPDLTCWPELIAADSGQRDFFSLGRNEGCIVHYNHVLGLGKIGREQPDRCRRAYEHILTNNVRIIHLIRSDRSLMVAELDRKKTGLTHVYNPRIETSQPPEPSAAEIIDHSAYMLWRRDELCSAFGPMLEVSYEWLTDEGSDTQVLCKEKAEPMLKHLDVKPMQLITPHHKVHNRKDAKC